MGRSFAVLIFSLFVRAQSTAQVGYAVMAADAGSPMPVVSALFSYTNAARVLVSQGQPLDLLLR